MSRYEIWKGCKKVKGSGDFKNSEAAYRKLISMKGLEKKMFIKER